MEKKFIKLEHNKILLYLSKELCIINSVEINEDNLVIKLSNPEGKSIFIKADSCNEAESICAYIISFLKLMEEIGADIEKNIVYIENIIIEMECPECDEKSGGIIIRHINSNERLQLILNSYEDAIKFNNLMQTHIKYFI